MRITVSGTRAPEEMPVGMYVVECVGFEEKKRGRSSFIVLRFRVIEPRAYAGVLLLEWLSVQEGLHPRSKYVDHWELASGRQVAPDTDLSPKIFVGQTFEVQATFRDKGDFRKDPKDFLRVSSIIRDHSLKPDIDIEHRHSPIGCGVGGWGGLNTN